MDGNKSTRKGHSYISQNVRESYTKEDSDSTGVISIEQLRHLVRLLDRSDVSELEINRSGEGVRLVLRKARVPEGNGQHPSTAPNTQFVDFPANSQSNIPATPSLEETRRYISAQLVGIFHRWAKPRGGMLVAIGDRVKVGQLVATIESLDVINDVESPITGRVVEILVQEGQPVEYGQHLMVIDGGVGEEGA
jgi:acetyl-CoA carboxylase biotin carboxyl carrier protein